MVSRIKTGGQIMNAPRGYNPIGESAPGLPRHDAGLPGHAPGSPSQPLGGADPSSVGSGGLNTAYTGPALPAWFTKPIARCVFFGWVYLTAPLQAALYPIAGAAGLAGAGVFYLLARAVGGGPDTRHGWAWAGCFLGVIALMPTETRFEVENPGYGRKSRPGVAFRPSVNSCRPKRNSARPASNSPTIVTSFKSRMASMLRLGYAMSALAGERRTCGT
jgi:hypothetical protein